MATVNSNAPLWYNNGIYGQFGYAVPNWGSNTATANQTIAQLVDLVGRNIFAIMQSIDADMRTPPSINTITNVHQLYVRVMGLLTSRAVPPGTPNMVPQHAGPNPKTFTVYPCPFFLVRNPQLQLWSSWGFMALTEMMQNTENAKGLDISTTFANTISQYFTRIYVNMCNELFGKAIPPGSSTITLLTPADLAAYNPSAFFTSTEMVDSVPPLNTQMTAEMLQVLAEGILVTNLPNLGPWPGDPIAAQAQAQLTANAAVAQLTGTANQGTPTANAQAAGSVSATFGGTQNATPTVIQTQIPAVAPAAVQTTAPATPSA